MPDPIPFSEVVLDIEAILRAFAEHGVAFVLVGGVAAQLAGSPLATEDVDLTPDDDVANLERAAAALDSLGAQWRVPGLTEGFPPPVPLRGADLEGKMSATEVPDHGIGVPGHRGGPRRWRESRRPDDDAHGHGRARGR